MSTLARTTIRLDEQLLREAKKLAAETGRTLTAVIEDALREALARKKNRATQKAAFKLLTFGSGGLRPGVDLDNSAALLDLLDAEVDTL